jgi:hypothetical protein
MTDRPPTIGTALRRRSKREKIHASKAKAFEQLQIFGSAIGILLRTAKLPPMFSDFT